MKKWTANNRDSLCRRFLGRPKPFVIWVRLYIKRKWDVILYIATVAYGFVRVKMGIWSYSFLQFALRNPRFTAAYMCNFEIFSIIANIKTHLTMFNEVIINTISWLHHWSHSADKFNMNLKWKNIFLENNCVLRNRAVVKSL